MNQLKKNFNTVINNIKMNLMIFIWFWVKNFSDYIIALHIIFIRKSLYYNFIQKYYFSEFFFIQIKFYNLFFKKQTNISISFFLNYICKMIPSESHLLSNVNLNWLQFSTLRLKFLYIKLLQKFFIKFSKNTLYIKIND